MRLVSGVRDDLLAHAREGSPEEVCGVLGGVRPDANDEEFVVETARRVPNVAASPRTEYTLDPGAQLEAMAAIEDAGRDVVGFYHTHPRGPLQPSATDEARATWPGYAYVVVVPDEGLVGCWRWTGERFEREDVVVN
jgi:proteasome lid subunit RPN8/RPN11